MTKKFLLGLVDLLEVVDEKIEQMKPVFKGKQTEYEYYDEETHRCMFSLEKQVRKGLEAEKRVITMDNPVFMF